MVNKDFLQTSLSQSSSSAEPSSILLAILANNLRVLAQGKNIKTEITLLTDFNWNITVYYCLFRAALQQNWILFVYFLYIFIYI